MFLGCSLFEGGSLADNVVHGVLELAVGDATTAISIDFCHDSAPNFLAFLVGCEGILKLVLINTSISILVKHAECALDALFRDKLLLVVCRSYELRIIDKTILIGVSLSHQLHDLLLVEFEVTRD